MASLKELLALAKSQAGYQEKASNACLDDFHENAGYRNYTKYSRDVDNFYSPGPCRKRPGGATWGMGSGIADTGDLYGCGLDHGRATSSGGIPKKPEIP